MPDRPSPPARCRFAPFEDLSSAVSLPPVGVSRHASAVTTRSYEVRYMTVRPGPTTTFCRLGTTTSAGTSPVGASLPHNLHKIQRHASALSVDRDKDGRFIDTLAYCCRFATRLDLVSDNTLPPCRFHTVGGSRQDPTARFHRSP